MAKQPGSRKTRTPRRKSAKNSLPPIQVHDSGYKLLFSHPAMVADLLNGFVAEDWVRELDFNTLEKQSGSYVSDDLRPRADDVVWRVRWRGRWLYVYLLLEFQSDVDRFMAVRLLVYVGLLAVSGFDPHRATHPGGSTTAGVAVGVVQRSAEVDSGDRGGEFDFHRAALAHRFSHATVEARGTNHRLQAQCLSAD